MRSITQSADWPTEAVFAPAGSLFRYRVYGLLISSQIQLALTEDPGSRLAEVELAVAEPDLIAERSAGAQMLPEADAWYKHAFLPDGSVYLRWERLFEFLVSRDGRTVLCGTLGAETMESFQVYLLGHALGFAAVLQVEEPLHATVVRLGNRAIGLLGNCGFGKSTLASYLLSTGARLITDDLLRLTFEGDRAIAHAGPQRIKLLPEPAERFLPEAARGVEMNPGSGKLIVPLPERCHHPEAAKLDALFVLDWPAEGEPADTIRSERLAGRDAFLAILASTFNTRVQDPDRLQRQFRFAEKLTAAVPLFRLVYPRELAMLPRVREEIERCGV